MKVKMKAFSTGDSRSLEQNQKKKKSIYNSSEKLKQQKNVQEKARTCQTTRNFGLLWFHMELKLDATQAC